MCSTPYSCLFVGLSVLYSMFVFVCRTQCALLPCLCLFVGLSVLYSMFVFVCRTQCALLHVPVCL